MKSKILMIALVAAPLSACANANHDMRPIGGAEQSAGACQSEKLQSLIGQRATSEIGGRILKESGAAKLRWGPPNSAWTMDLRTDRVNISYDDQMIITGISCG